ncbi:C40 family peptidase [Nucisporomicrobium flavum]|uniref:C40 family peptidase n=1 Tax=Nucisporomicrobium flavum TaxID=2785915 RepID=UPI0027DC9CB3|nr:NlpC/P60 family protein [Nucisporomicrobium flavum]
MSAPGRVRRLLLSRPTTGRVLAAGALALAVSAPALEPVHIAAEARPTPVLAVAPAAVADATLQARSRDRVASRTAARRSATRPAAIALRAAHRQIATVRRAEKSRRAAELRAAAQRRAIAQREARVAAQHRRALAEGRVQATGAERRAPARRASPRRASARRVQGERRAHVSPARHAVRHRVKQRTRRSVPAGMSAVIAFARAQVGKRYSAGAEGPNAFDCSGFTKRAYARAGINLPHSSGAQAARARSISRSAARPGDLVVGAGHVGIYMGGGMMIDAGNPRTGVVYRRMYAGLHIERL